MWRSLLPLTFLLFLSTPRLCAQELANPRLAGRVMRLGRDSVGVPGASVVLHMVTADSSGEIDSTRAGAQGDFTFRHPSVPDPLGRGEVYLASVTHQDILYFGPAVS